MAGSFTIFTWAPAQAREALILYERFSSAKLNLDKSILITMDEQPPPGWMSTTSWKWCSLGRSSATWGWGLPKSQLIIWRIIQYGYYTNSRGAKWGAIANVCLTCHAPRENWISSISSLDVMRFNLDGTLWMLWSITPLCNLWYMIPSLRQFFMPLAAKEDVMWRSYCSWRFSISVWCREIK